MKSTTHVLLIYGGESSEHEISIRSALNIQSSLDELGHLISYVYITRAGEWLHVQGVSDSLNGSAMMPQFGTGSLLNATTNEHISPDVIFPVLHGCKGEDGTVQSVAQLLHIPCVGPSVLGAAVTMNKDATKHLLRGAGLKTAQWIVWNKNKTMPPYDSVVRTLGLPFFVKPIDAGSSVGVTKVHSINEYSPALRDAAHHSDQVIIEEFIDGKEYEVSVLGDGSQVSGVGEIIPGEEFYSYEDKYSDASTARADVSPRLRLTQKNMIRDIARRAYLATYGTGMARVDFLVKSDGTVYVSEINSIPGFTNISMYPKLWQAEGMSQSDLVTNLIEDALARN
jgi:D-alanine-D-alanine ligase